MTGGGGEMRGWKGQHHTWDDDQWWTQGTTGPMGIVMMGQQGAGGGGLGDWGWEKNENRIQCWIEGAVWGFSLCEIKTNTNTPPQKHKRKKEGNQ